MNSRWCNISYIALDAIALIDIFKGTGPQPVNRPSIAIAPSPVRPEIITVPLTTLTRESGAPAQPPLPPPPPATPSRIIQTPTQPEPVTIPPAPPSPPPSVRTPQRVVATPSPPPAQPPAPRTNPTVPPRVPQSILFTRPTPQAQTPSTTTRTVTSRPKIMTTTTSSDSSVERQVNPRPPFAAPSGKTLLNPHTENYCDIRQYPDEALSEKRLQRVEYFVANLSCSRQFFECAVGQTYLMNCTSSEQVFDIGTVNCNFKSSVKACPEFDIISHCSMTRLVNFVSDFSVNDTVIYLSNKRAVPGGPVCVLRNTSTMYIIYETMWRCARLFWRRGWK